jgi:hypothetical protein
VYESSDKSSIIPEGVPVIHPIVRIFDSAQKAADATSKLKGWGPFTEEQITVIPPSAATSADGGVSAVTAAYVLKSRANVYAESLRRGHTLVVVHAPFGTGGLATEILNWSGPVSTRDVLEEERRATPWDEAAPLSSTFRLPVISQWRAFGGLPTLSKRNRTLCSALGIPELAEPRATTEAFGLPMLKR